MQACRPDNQWGEGGASNSETQNMHEKGKLVTFCWGEGLPHQTLKPTISKEKKHKENQKNKDTKNKKQGKFSRKKNKEKKKQGTEGQGRERREIHVDIYRDK